MATTMQGANASLQVPFQIFSMENLEYLDISNFDTHKVVDYFGMFNGNSKLTTIVYGDNFVYTNDARLDVMLEQCPANKPIHESWNGIF